MLPLNIAVFAMPCTHLEVTATENAISRIAFVPTSTPLQSHPTPLLQCFSEQLLAYLADPAFVFDLPLAPEGSAFQLKVWQTIATIPSGETRSYLALAESIQSGARAIGNACGRNPHPVVVPCHRVIAKNGGMGGFNRSAVGGFVEIKRWLLAHEKKA